MTTKWPVQNAWVNKKPTNVDKELYRYHPDTDTRGREQSSYIMDLISSGSENQYVIKVKDKGPDGPTKAWDSTTKKLLLGIVLNETSPSQLKSAPNISLQKVINQTFGKWEYVSITVVLEIKIDPITKLPYQEYTTNMLWIDPKKNAVLPSTSTSYKWRN